MFPEKKGTLVALFIVLNGIVCIPVYWLRDASLAAFHVLCTLYVVFAVIAYIITIVFSIFIPHCMRTAVEREGIATPLSQQTLIQDTKNLADIKPREDGASTTKASISRKYGFKMSIFGTFGTAMGGIIALLVVIILYKTIPGTDGQSAGLLVTMIPFPARPKDNWKAWWAELFTPLKDMGKRKNMAALLLSYTSYVDTLFVLSSVTGQLYFVEILPDALEFTLYTMATTIFGAITTLAFYSLQVWRPPFKIEQRLVIGYSLVLVIPIWGRIELADDINFGFKNRGEFYVQNLLFQVSNSIVSSVFRVLFSEMVPKGSEVEWCGLQVILSCATAWVSYVTNVPLQNATHELRFLWSNMSVFAKDKQRWKDYDEGVASSSDSA
ncbi:uncharacterized protein RAG0_07746 [Rhynchosporium agropyri]|uniref:Autophagy-related protein n=1 Tax=Rhynchosporium agropyri TaxID=914238 RepID=A0A1E1KN43_9HELO|nr:uncharacterized protein RAG0_07746 [Rhynchosporium agropyri]